MRKGLCLVLGLAALNLAASISWAQGYGDAMVNGLELARRKACQNNLHEIGLAMMMYAGDHEEAFPKSFGVLLHDGYVTMAKVLHCPSDAQAYKEPDKHDWKHMEVAEIDTAIEPVLSYTLVEGVDHKDAPDTIVAYEHDGAHKGTGRHALFVDGAVKWFAEADFQKKLAEQRQRPGAKKPEKKP